MARCVDEKIENLPDILADSLRECRDMQESIITRLDELEETIKDVSELSGSDISR